MRSPANFRAMLARLDRATGRVLRAAQSLFHDIGPARKVGLATRMVR